MDICPSPPYGGDTIEPERREPDADTLRGWIDEARGGSGRAFDDLARHFLPRLRRWALVRTGDVDEADDVVQAVLVRAWSRMGSLRSAEAVSVWLYRITQTVAGERTRRRRSRQRALQRLESGHPEPAVEASPSEEDGLAAVVHTFLDELSERQRAMMDLVDLQGISPREAARMLEINESTARVHLLRARRRIRSLILQARPDVVENLR